MHVEDFLGRALVQLHRSVHEGAHVHARQQGYADQGYPPPALREGHCSTVAGKRNVASATKTMS